MDLSVITSTYNSSNIIESFSNEILEVIKSQDNINYFEIIVVDDGSTDDTIQKLIILKKKIKELKIIELSNNFGHYDALKIGIEHCSGKKVFLIDSDLEEHPNILGEFIKKIDINKYDLVYGYQKKRTKFFIDNLFSYFFYKLFNLISNSKIPYLHTSSHLMTERFVKALLNFKEKNFYIYGLIHSLGYPKIGIEVKKIFKLESSYTFYKKSKLFINAITSFSSFPLYIIFILGLALTFISFGFGSYLLIYAILFQKQLLPGWASLMIFISFFMGFLILSVGILGIYISKIYSEVKSRPVIIKNKYF
jgi:putative glycosyltransferase